ncbi:MAG TPA: SpaA isopeptide-forming pilin-related protein [Cyclobacteriaceae bacterium]|jgi:hypothetical protein|nr:SpaA isopeptide-forming pilin-related protein [Cyclobacteriaceae bacterium]
MKTALKTLVAVSFILLLASFQLIKTQIAVTIRDELGNTVEGAKVVLYEKEEDYNTETNPVAEGTTDVKGVVKFKELKPITYFILAKKDEKDNSGGGEQTGKLEANRINKVTVVIQ